MRKTLRRQGRRSLDAEAIDPTAVLLVAAIVFYGLLLAIGPTSVLDAMPDLDLGGGISMTPDGQIKVKNDLPTSMRIPEESEYEGITMP